MNTPETSWNCSIPQLDIKTVDQKWNRGFINLWCGDIALVAHTDTVWSLTSVLLVPSLLINVSLFSLSLSLCRSGSGLLLLELISERWHQCEQRREEGTHQAELCISITVWTVLALNAASNLIWQTFGSGPLLELTPATGVMLTGMMLVDSERKNTGRRLS